MGIGCELVDYVNRIGKLEARRHVLTGATMSSAASGMHSPKSRAARLRRVSFHLARFGLFAGIVLLIHQQHRWYQAQQAGADAESISLPQIRSFYPQAAKLGDWNPQHGGRTVLDESGEPLGYFVQTSPKSDRIVGYSGSTNTLIAFDQQGKVLGIEILSSGDTAEHVADIVGDARFMSSLNGLSWEQAASTEEIDAVSGATLTSLAIVDGIRLRLGGQKPSLRFPNPPTVDEVKQVFPTAAELMPRERHPLIQDVVDAQGKRLGGIIRTSPAADDVMGYQGPTDTLVFLDRDNKVLGLSIRGSFDNTKPEDFVGYVRDDDYFKSLFVGKTLEQLASLDPEQAEIEGVSGATMTSMSVAYALPKAAKAALVAKEPARPTFVVAWRDVGTVAVLVFALVLTFSKLRRLRCVRVCFQVVLVVYLGFLNGDMISQALVVGWAQTGVPWRLAPGLVLLSLAALAVPLLSKKQVYCHHVCPFGAAQQLVKNRLPWRVRLPRRLTKLLSLVPALLLLLVIATAISHLPINLAGIEPFDAFLFRIAGWATLAIAVVGLIGSAFIPMAYCRFGCPTGSVLNYLRYNARSGRISRRDVAAIALLLMSVVLQWI